MSQTQDAIDLLTTCLVVARPLESGMARRFKQQQAAGAATRPAKEPFALPSDLGENVLKSIVVNAKPFEEALAQAPAAVAFNDFMARGNLLLLCDKPKEARQAFETGLRSGQECAALRCPGGHCPGHPGR